jgi:hypothetical protein
MQVADQEHRFVHARVQVFLQFVQHPGELIFVARKR